MFTAGPDDAGRRLDRVLRILLEGLPLSSVYKALRTKRIVLNGRKADASTLLAEGDVISVDADLATESPVPGGGGRIGTKPIAPRGPDLESITMLRTADILILNKPRGLATHGPGGLDRMVRDAFPTAGASSLAFSPAPLHRLDRNTTGLVAFSLSMRGAHAFTAALRAGLIRKSYLAVLEGRLDRAEVWEDRLERDGESRRSGISADGEKAVSALRPLALSGSRCLALVTIATGRTHQIRAQCAAHGHPLAGDLKYGGTAGMGGYVLHAWSLETSDGILEGLPRQLTAPLPAASWAACAREFGAAILEGLGITRAPPPDPFFEGL